MSVDPVEVTAAPIASWRVQLLADTWCLDDRDLASLWHVPVHQAIRWRYDGVPADQSDAVVPLLEAAEHLSSRIRATLIPAAVRRPLTSAGGRSVLELAHDDPDAARAAATTMPM